MVCLSDPGLYLYAESSCTSSTELYWDLTSFQRTYHTEDRLGLDACQTTRILLWVFTSPCPGIEWRPYLVSRDASISAELRRADETTRKCKDVGCNRTVQQLPRFIECAFGKWPSWSASEKVSSAFSARRLSKSYLVWCLNPVCNAPFRRAVTEESN